MPQITVDVSIPAETPSFPTSVNALQGTRWLQTDTTASVLLILATMQAYTLGRMERIIAGEWEGVPFFEYAKHITVS